MEMLELGQLWPLTVELRELLRLYTAPLVEAETEETRSLLLIC